eukprot:4382076-Prymnesium_polylepis.1
MLGRAHAILGRLQQVEVGCTTRAVEVGCTTRAVEVGCTTRAIGRRLFSGGGLRECGARRAAAHWRGGPEAHARGRMRPIGMPGAARGGKEWPRAVPGCHTHARAQGAAHTHARVHGAAHTPARGTVRPLADAWGAAEK